MRQVNVIVISCMLGLLVNCKSGAQMQECYKNEAVKELNWLQERIEKYEKSGAEQKAEIYQYTYNEETVFLADMCVQCPDFITVVYNCKGEVICEFGGIMGKNTCPDFYEKAADKKLIWRSRENE